MKPSLMLFYCTLAFGACAPSLRAENKPSVEVEVFQAAILEIMEHTRIALIIADSTVPSNWTSLIEAQKPPEDWGPGTASAALGQANAHPHLLSDPALVSWAKKLDRRVIFVPLTEARRRVYHDNKGGLVRFSAPALNASGNCALLGYSLGNDPGIFWLRRVGKSWVVFKQQFQTLIDQ
jgi:hypothetical protein